MRIAERIGEHRAQALARQEKSSGRWSQTLENLNAINRVVDMPVLRPLIGWTRKR
jgi:thiamine biosynthesis protein ThiI